MKRNLLFLLAVSLMLLNSSFNPVHAQKKHISLKDSLDKSFDLSDYVIDANGFVPIPLIITEPALGGFGGALIPVFIKKRSPYTYSRKGKSVLTPVAPDITGAAGIYTANKTWGIAAFRSGTLIKSNIKYMLGGGYANVNMSFYETFDQIGEKEFKLNIKTIPAFLQVTKRIGLSYWYAGVKYLFLKTDIKFTGDSVLNDLAKSFELNKTISQAGVVIELDKRDNIFTPDKGIKLHVDGGISDDAIGSDYDYWRMNYYLYAYKPLFENLICGWRFDGQQTFGDPPFYMEPFIDMRGVPAERYPGRADLLSELELRWNVVNRWSLMLFGGAGKAFDKWNEFGDAEWVWSYGTGFRYLLARKLKLRTGIDIAHGPGTWAYYIVFGSSWLK